MVQEEVVMLVFVIIPILILTAVALIKVFKASLGSPFFFLLLAIDENLKL
jgi:hypothetical protein